jgi:HEAT repeat protein
MPVWSVSNFALFNYLAAKTACMIQFRYIFLIFICCFLIGCNWFDDSKKRNIDGLITKLQAPEPVARDSAKAMIGNYLFLKGDLPQLYEAITTPYPDDSLGANSTRAQLITVLKGVNSEDTPEFIRTTYPTLPRDPELQFTALSVLSEMNTPASLDVLRALLTDDPPDLGKKTGELFQPFYESPKHLGHLFPQLITLVNNRNFRFPVMETLMVGLENETIDKKSLTDSLYIIRELYRAEKKKLKAYRTESPKAMGTKSLMEVSLKCLSHFPNETASRQVLDLALEDEDPEIKLSAAIARIHAGAAPDPKILLDLAANYRTRNSLYLQLMGSEQQNAFPDSFLTQEAFAESDLAGWINAQPEPALFPKKMEIAGRYPLDPTDESEGGYVYLIKFNMGYGWLAGISGPQPLDTTLVIPSGYLTNSFFKRWSAQKPEEHIEELMVEAPSE